MKFNFAKSIRIYATILIFMILGLSISFVFIVHKNSLINHSSAGGYDMGRFYDNAPTIMLNDGQALFNMDGTINNDTLIDLLNKINNADVINNNKNNNGVSYLTAKNFGQYHSEGTESNGNSQIILKLFETTNVTDNHLDLFTSQYWQVVFRSTDDNKDVLTLYMCSPYYYEILFQNADYMEGIYSNSVVRQVLNNVYSSLTNEYQNLENYIALPAELPGNWQSSINQTSAKNANGELYVDENGNSYGASGFSAYGGIQNSYSLNNGLDGESAVHNDWTQIIQDCSYDALWLPSTFEVFHTGFAYGDNTTTITGSSFDNSYVLSRLNNSAESNADLNVNGSTQDGRTGLWELNAYDRAYPIYSWLRSGISVSAIWAMVSVLDGDCGYDGTAGHGGTYQYGVRPAIHIDLNKFLTDIQIGDTSGDLVVTPEVTGGLSIQDLPEISSAEQNSYLNKVVFDDDRMIGTKEIVYSFDTNIYSLVLQSNNAKIYCDKNQESITTDDFTLSYVKNANNVILTVNKIKHELNLQFSLLYLVNSSLEIEIPGFNEETSFTEFIIVLGDNSTGEVLTQLLVNNDNTIELNLLNSIEYYLLFKLPYNASVSYTGSGTQVSSCKVIIDGNLGNSTHSFKFNNLNKPIHNVIYV